MWYTRPDGEVVSDTQIFDIEKCLDNDVNLVWSAARVQPGERATLDLSAAPQSICSLGKRSYIELYMSYMHKKGLVYLLYEF